MGELASRAVHKSAVNRISLGLRFACLAVFKRASIFPEMITEKYGHAPQTEALPFGAVVFRATGVMSALALVLSGAVFLRSLSAHLQRNRITSTTRDGAGSQAKLWPRYAISLLVMWLAMFFSENLLRFAATGFFVESYFFNLLYIWSPATMMLP